MKNILLIALAFVCCLEPVMGQKLAFKSETLTIANFDENGTLISQEKYKSLEAAQFDIPQYLNQNSDIARIKIDGKFYHDSELRLIKFDTETQVEKNLNGVFCESTEMSLKPFLGISAHCNDGNGVQIETVIQDSPAAQFEIDEGDIVLNFNDKQVNSFCTLTKEIAACEIGQVISMTIKEGEQIITRNVTIGAQIIHNVSFKSCPISEADLTVDKRDFDATKAEMIVYPNPSTGSTRLDFISTSTNEATFYVMDINGSVIHKKQISNFDGSLKTDFTFKDHVEGSYVFVIEQDGKVHRNKVVHIKN